MDGRPGAAEDAASRRPRSRRWLIGAAPAALALLMLASSCSHDPTSPGRRGGRADAIPVCGDADVEGYIWSWDPSSGGAPAVVYEVEIRSVGEGWRQGCSTQMTAVRIKHEGNHQLRVRGLDDRGRSGPWSQASDWSDVQVETSSGSSGQGGVTGQGVCQSDCVSGRSSNRHPSLENDR